MNIFKRGAAVVAAFAAVAGAVALAPLPAGANQDVVPVEFPQTGAPRVLDGRVYAFDTHGDYLYVGGTFTTIRNPASGSTEIAQRGLFRFNMTTRTIDQSFMPQFNGDVEGLALSADGSALYVGGSFTQVNGQAVNRLVKLSTSNGTRITAFNASVPATIRDLALTSNAVIIGGNFGKINGQNAQKLGAVNPTTGATLTSWNTPLTGPRDQFGAYMQEFDLSSNGQWLVVGGNFTHAVGEPREQVAVFRVNGASATLAQWSTTRYANDCASVYDATWIRGISISPDNRFFVINTTGAYFTPPSLCDTTARWELPVDGPLFNTSETWSNYTGGDTHWQALVTDAAVIAGGHQRWENNANPTPGGDNDGPGAVSRPGIAALDPLTGVPLSWNPTRGRGRGVEALLATDDYLFVGSDTVYFNGQLRQRVAILPTAGGTANPDPDQIRLPVDMRVAMGSSLYNVDFNGSTFSAPSLVSGPSVDGENWTSVRDGFVQLGQFVYFGSGNAYYRRPFNGTTFGPPTNLSASVGYVDATHNNTSFDQPYNVTETRDATYSNGRIFYTRTNDTRLWWRRYSLQSGIIGAQEYVASSVSFSGARALDIVGDWMYIAWQDGKLYRAFVDGKGNVAGSPSTWAVVDSGGSGINWANVTAIFSTNADGTADPPDPPEPVVCNDPAAPWRAEYYANSTLSGAPLLVRCDAAINADWGTGGPPGTGLGADQFSIRWERAYPLDATKMLNITAGSDDGIRVFIDGQTVINEWRDRAYTVNTAQTAPLAAGDHQIKVEFYENGGDARVLTTIDQVTPPDTTAPETSISSPSANQTIDTASTSVAGTATDDAGVGDVSVSVRDAGAAYLQADGTFAPTPHAFDATLASPGATSTAWSVQLPPLPDGAYAAEATARDAADNADASPATVGFTIDTTPPDTQPPSATVAVPTTNQVFDVAEPVLSGTASDDVGVGNVRVAVRDRDSLDYLQPNGTWAAGYVLLPAVLDNQGQPSSAWTFQSPVALPNASYALTVVTRDTSNNVDPAKPWVPFRVAI